VVVKAKTGTGKTLAFLIPAVEQVLLGDGGPQLHSCLRQSYYPSREHQCLWRGMQLGCAIGLWLQRQGTLLANRNQGP